MSETGFLLRRKYFRSCASLGVLLTMLAHLGCRKQNAYVAPPPPEVAIATVSPQPVTIYREYTGTTQAVRSVEVRARVEGYLSSINFTDGQRVSKGELLFEIDQRPFQAQVEQARAELEGKRATANETQSVYRRTEILVPSGAATREQADIDRGQWLVAKAAVLQAQAALTQAELDLNYTRIAAAIDGRIGRHLVDIGNLIMPGTTLLANIDQYDPMYAYFTVSEKDYLSFLEHRRNSKEPESTTKPDNVLTSSSNNSAATAAAKPNMGPAASKGVGSLAAPVPNYPIGLGLANEEGYPHQGHIDFTDSKVDPSTGTILFRGVFPNPWPYALAPGLFARIHLPLHTIPDALVVPERALGADQSGRYLLIVGRDNVVEHRAVKTGSAVKDGRVVLAGLRSGERFVLEGLQKARSGMKVAPIQSRGEKQPPKPSPG